MVTIEVDRTLTRDGLVTLLGHHLPLGPNTAETCVAARIEGGLIHAIAGNHVIKTLPNLLNSKDDGRLTRVRRATTQLHHRRRQAPNAFTGASRGTVSSWSPGSDFASDAHMQEPSSPWSSKITTSGFSTAPPNSHCTPGLLRNRSGTSTLTALESVNHVPVTLCHKCPETTHVSCAFLHNQGADRCHRTRLYEQGKLDAPSAQPNSELSMSSTASMTPERHC